MKRTLLIKVGDHKKFRRSGSQQGTKMSEESRRLICHAFEY